MRISDKIVSPTRGTLQQALAIATIPLTRQYMTEVYRLSPLTGIDASIVIAQWHLETDGGKSARWLANGNPAGLGIESDEDTDPATFSGVEAARVHLWALSHACDTNAVPINGFLPASAKAFVARWTAKYADPACPTVTTIDDLNIRYVDQTGEPQASWAWDADYEDKFVQRGALVFGNVPDQSGGPEPVADLTFGKVPHPAYEDRIIPNSQNSAWDDLGTRTVRAVVWHRMLGSLTGTDGYFRGEGGSRALTDYGVGVIAQDGANLDGVIYRWNDPQGHRSPWANGSVSAPYGDGLAFVNRFGVNGVNRDATAIEISGFEETPLSPKSRAAICGITAYWADHAKIPWDQFPEVPGEARSFVIWHEEFTIGTGKLCPFGTVKAETNSMIEQTKGILKKYQTASTTPTPKPPTYADPIVPDWLTNDLKDGKPNDHIWTVDIDGKETRVEVFAAHRPFVATKSANRLQLPFTGAKKVGPRIEVRETFMGRNYAKVGNKTFVQTDFGTWVDSSALTPRISIRKA